MDRDTAAHLAAWATVRVHPDEYDSFVAWVHDLDADDLAHYERNGWPAAFAAFLKETSR